MKTFMKFSALIAWVLTFAGVIVKVNALSYIGIFMVLVLLFMSIYEVANSKKLNRDYKLLWLIGLLPGNMFMMPIYYLIYRERITGQ